MNMNLHHLSIFHAVAEAGSLSVAAKRLHISQPAISRQLKWFEASLGLVFFERVPRGMRLTQAGEVLHDYAKRLFEIERAATAAMREISGLDRGTLSIGASNTIGTYLLPAWLAKFRQKYPLIAVSVFIGNTAQVSEGVADLRFSCGFIEGPLHFAGLRVELLLYDEIFPVVASTHPLATLKRIDLVSLATLPLLMRESGSGTREVVSAMLEALKIVPTNVMCLGNTEALKQAALEGGGIAWLPRLSMERELAAGELVPLRVPKLKIQRALHMVRGSSPHMAPAGEAFLGVVRAAIKH